MEISFHAGTFKVFSCVIQVALVRAKARSKLPLFRQGGVTVDLTTRLSAGRDQGGSMLLGRFAEVMREMLIRWDILGIL